MRGGGVPQVVHRGEVSRCSCNNLPQLALLPPPNPIGVLLNLKHMQLFPPSRASVSLNPDKESAEQQQQGTSCTIKRQFERLPDCLMWSFKKKKRRKKISNTRTHLKVNETISVIQELKKSLVFYSVNIGMIRLTFS